MVLRFTKMVTMSPDLQHAPKTPKLMLIPEHYFHLSSHNYKDWSKDSNQIIVLLNASNVQSFNRLEN